MTMHKALHPSDDKDRPYVSRKAGGRGLVSIDDSVDKSIRRLEDYIKRAKNSNYSDQTQRTPYNDQQSKISSKQKWEENQ